MRLLYLHGVGDDGTRRDWWRVLQSVVGDPLDDVDVLAPDYSAVLSGEALPSGVGHHRSALGRPHAPLLARRGYRARQASLHADLTAAGATSRWPYRRRGFGRVPDMLDAVGERFVMDFIYEQVNRYHHDEHLRRAVRAQATELLPESGPVVILGHSLGALVAIDLIRHLPPGVHVPLLVTAASALARRRMPGIVADFPHSFPYDRVGGWINVFNPADAVTRGRPIGVRFPQAVDVVAAGPLGDHSLATCVTEPGVARALLEHLRRPGGLHHAVALHSDERPLALATSCELVTWLLVRHLGELTAQRAGSRPDHLGRYEAARQLTVLRASQHTKDPVVREGADPAELLHDRLAEANLPAVLVRLALDDPLAGLHLSAPKALVAEARRHAAADIGVPPDWVEMAARFAEEAAAPVRRTRPRHAARPRSARASQVAAAIEGVLTPLGLRGHGRDRAAADLPGACQELVARALVARRLGQQDPGTEERAALHRVLLLLTDEGGPSDEEPLLRGWEDNVRASLALLTDRGLGLSPPRARMPVPR